MWRIDVGASLEPMLNATGPREEHVMYPVSDSDIRELESRSNDGIDVTLLWSDRSNQIWVSVVDERRGTAFVLDVDPSEALDAFHHPFAYAGHADSRLPVAA